MISSAALSLEVQGERSINTAGRQGARCKHIADVPSADDENDIEREH
jgi:hypothetical protein